MLTWALTVEPGKPTLGSCTSSSSRSLGIVSAPTPTVWTGTPKLAISAILGGIEVGGVVGAIGHEHDGRDGARLRAAQHVQQRIADVRDGPGRRHLLERRQLDERRRRTRTD